jgi:DNA-binding LacI/PurR family transcriptional regulator
VPIRTVISTPKYKQIFDSLKESIVTGVYATGQRLPSEAKLVEAFDASRLTVNRALRELQLAGLIDRRVGSGSYVTFAPVVGQTFGLLIPELGQTEIFEPICRGMAEAQHVEHHALLWGKTLANSPSTYDEVKGACRQLLANKIAGLFFAPFELSADKDRLNRLIVDTFDSAQVPVVLLDRDLVPYPDRSCYDLVGIDNRRAGYVLTACLLQAGCRRLAFIGRPRSAPTVDARIAGFREALSDAAAPFDANSVWRIDPNDAEAVRERLQATKPDGLFCANDLTAAQLMRTLDGLGLSVPDDLRLGGIDDVKYASLLPVPLTTIHQPCSAIGSSALMAMSQRIKSPTSPARDILLGFDLVVRRSSAPPTK